MIQISPTELKVYLECPRYYWWYYINPSTRWQYPPQSYFTMGNHVHSALQYLFNLPIQERSKRALLDHFRQVWQTKTGTKGGFKSKEIEDDCYERSQLMLSAFFDREDTTVVPLWAKDTTLKANVSEFLGFKGKIDRIDELPDGLHIIDYKTGQEREDEWQLPIYAAIARRIFKKPVARVSYHFLETGSWVDQPTNSAREAMLIGRIEQLLQSMPKQFNREAWVCPDGELCAHCNYLKEYGLDPAGTVIEMPQLTTQIN